MIKKKNIKTVVLLMLMSVIFILSLTGCSGNGISIFKPTVDLNTYVTVNPLGYNGAGRVEVIFDYEKLTQDYQDKIKKNLDEKYFGDRKGVDAANHAFSYYFPYRLVPDVNEGYEYGDVVTFRWVTSEPGLEALEAVLNLKYQHTDMEYTMEGLPEGRMVNIFENMNVDYSGIDGSGTVSMYNAYGTFLDKNGEVVNVDLDVDHGYRSEWKNGDTVHVKVSDKYREYYFSDYYGVEFESTEMDYELTNFSYYPTNGREAIDGIETASFQKLNTAMLADLDKIYAWTESTRQVEFIGTMFFYQNKDNDLDIDNVSNNLKNKMIFIYRITDKNNPNGWYTYVSAKNDMLMVCKELEDGTVKKVTRLDTGKEFYKTLTNYEKPRTADDKLYPIKFKLEGVQNEYTGNPSLSNLIEGIVEYHKAKQPYDHLAVSSNLAGYARQY